MACCFKEEVKKKKTAYHLWEVQGGSQGKFQGTAEENWLEAEHIVCKAFLESGICVKRMQVGSCTR